MRIEILETFTHGRDDFEKGDIRTVSDELGAYFCAAGWAKDKAGKAETAERDTSAVVLAPESNIHGHKAGEV